MAIVPNPFIQTYTRIWTLLEAHAPFTTLVNLRNRIRFDEEKQAPLIDSRITADLPVVELVPTGGSFDIFNTTQTSEAIKAFSIGSFSGDLRLQKQHFDLQWEIARALGKGGVQLGLTFINRWELTDGIDIKDEPQENLKGSQGWTHLQVITVIFRFSRIELTE